MSAAPQLSVVVVTPTCFAQVRRTVHALRSQSAAGASELVLVAPRTEDLDDRRPDELDGFAAVRCVGVGPIGNVDHASADGVHAATAPVVAIIEDHAFPEPEWAQAIIAAHQAPVAAVQSVMRNANPHSSLSWVNLLLAYGQWVDPGRAGAVDSVALHNTTAKRDLLVRHGAALAGKLGRDGTLFDELRAEGHTFSLEARARVAHVNPSRLSSTTDLRVSAGRLYGHRRAAEESWSKAKRLLYVALGPLIPAIRLLRVGREHLVEGPYAHLRARLLPALVYALCCDAVGQVLGYAAGPGRTRETLATFEMDRIQHLSSADRAELAP